MTYVPITPFRRTVDAAVIQHQTYANAPLPPKGVNKWEALRELTTARVTFGITDRSLGVLQALLSFHPDTILGGNSEKALIVYPSNVAICERLNGMPCSTMRRHLAGLVQAGVILRRDSPNGKRFVKRFANEPQAFGFDLTPIVARFAEICEAAETTRAAQNAYDRLRRSVSLMKRDLAGLVGFGLETRPEVPLWSSWLELSANAARALRRRLDLEELAEMGDLLLHALNDVRDLLDSRKTVKAITNGVQIEQHYQNSNKDHYDLEPPLEQVREESAALKIESEQSGNQKLPNIPLAVVLQGCGEFRNYVPDEIRHWHQLVRAAEVVRPMMGISPSAWDDAMQAMGPEEASVVLLAMLERFDEIKSPGGYLRHLTVKAERGEFSCGPMIMALMRREAA